MLCLNFITPSISRGKLYVYFCSCKDSPYTRKTTSVDDENELRDILNDTRVHPNPVNFDFEVLRVRSPPPSPPRPLFYKNKSNLTLKIVYKLPDVTHNHSYVGCPMKQRIHFFFLVSINGDSGSLECELRHTVSG